MKKTVLLTLLLCCTILAQAAFVQRMPVIKMQPNGDTLHCFVTGDEYYQRLHDGLNYTIVRNPSTGYYVYADRQWTSDRSDWQLVPTPLVAGRSNPVDAQLMPGLAESPATVARLHKRFDIPEQYRMPESKSPKEITNHGTINNIVIFIRFADDSAITTPFSTINSMFNDSSAEAVSMHNYFWRASYSQLRIPTHFYPTPSADTILSYQDIFPRSYYMPYDSVNTNGYTEDQRADREFSLLERAVNYINANSPVPTDLNIDYNNDGFVDNICFVIKGTYTGWSDLLWPHKWGIYDRYVTINGKRVYTFNLQLEGSGSHYFSTSTFCHEMFHTLGAPDLYHYYAYTHVTGVGQWDLMCSNTTPPQHMGVFMKMRYGRWVDSIPEITEAGTYTLHSVGDSLGQNICYRIQAGDPSQWYFLEYRDNRELFEEGLPGRGLVIYRADTRYNGNANFDAETTFDEYYLFRPGATDDTTNGYTAQAFFNASSGRDAFTPNTDPFPWLTGNVIDTTLYITDISDGDETITFTYTPHKPQAPACDDSCTITVEMRDQYGDTWNGSYLRFETLDGIPEATLAMGDGRIWETRSVTLCDRPHRLIFYYGSYPEECSVTITLADGTTWYDGYPYEDFYEAEMETPCGVPTYHLSVASNYELCTVTGEGDYAEGTDVPISATAAEGYRFIGWHDGNYDPTETSPVIHDSNPNRTITIASDTMFTAIFEPTQGFNNDYTMGTLQLIPRQGAIFIQGIEGKDAEVYDVIGRLIATLPASGHPTGSATVAVPASGLYIVRTHNGECRKITVF